MTRDDQQHAPAPLRPRHYLDHAATSWLRPDAEAAMAYGRSIWANPSSPHSEGRRARAAVEDARTRAAAALDWGGELVFTSGASEAIERAVVQAQCDALIVGATEHAVVHLAAAGAMRRDLPVFHLDVEPTGLVNLDGLAHRLAETRATRPLVAIQTTNSETGVCQPEADIASVIAAAGGLWLADAAQSAAKSPLPPADLIVVSAHKFGGPVGVGALLVRDLGALSPTGGQEQGYRPGTENLPAILGMAAALEAPRAWLADAAHLRKRLDEAVVSAGGEVVAAGSPRLPSIAAYRLPGKKAAAQLIAFDLAGVAISAGSACSSGSLKPSPVLTAMGWSEAAAAEVVRVSLGWSSRAEDVEAFLAVWWRLAAGRDDRLGL